MLEFIADCNWKNTHSFLCLTSETESVERITGNCLLHLQTQCLLTYFLNPGFEKCTKQLKHIDIKVCSQHCTVNNTKQP
jgi:hypothetical protein